MRSQSQSLLQSHSQTSRKNYPSMPPFATLTTPLLSLSATPSVLTLASTKSPFKSRILSPLLSSMLPSLIFHPSHVRQLLSKLLAHLFNSLGKHQRTMVTAISLATQSRSATSALVLMASGTLSTIRFVFFLWIHSFLQIPADFFKVSRNSVDFSKVLQISTDFHRLL